MLRVLVVIALLLASACGPTTTVRLKDGTVYVGRETGRTPDRILMRAKRKIAPGDDRRWGKPAELKIPRVLIEEIRTRNRPAFTAGITGTSMMLSGLLCLGIAGEAFSSRRDENYREYATVSLGILTGVGAVIGAWGWATFIADTDTEPGQPMVRVSVDGLRVTF